jgi:hypothetical protein
MHIELPDALFTRQNRASPIQKKSDGGVMTGWQNSVSLSVIFISEFQPFMLYLPLQ